MHLLSILFSSLPSHVFSGNPILHNIFSLFQQCSAVQWFGQCSRMPVCLVFYYVVYGRPCPLLLYVLHVLRWQKIQNSVCFYLPYSFLYSSGVANYKHKYMVIMPIIAILFFDDVVYEWPSLPLPCHAWFSGGGCHPYRSFGSHFLFTRKRSLPLQSHGKSITYLATAFTLYIGNRSAEVSYKQA